MKKSLKPLLTTLISLVIFTLSHAHSGTYALDSGYVCNAGFTYKVDTTGVPTYTFTAKETDPNLSYSWNFEDQGYASGREVEHIFFDGGIWSVYLTVSNGTDSCTTSQQITAIAPDQCYFNYEKISDATIKVSTYSPSTHKLPYSFDFGDGTVVLDTMSSPIKDFYHTYDSAGTYQVCIYKGSTAADSCSYCRAFDIGNPTPTDTTGCDASFTVNQINNSNYVFRALQRDSVNQYTWRINGSKAGNALDLNYSFTEKGLYTVSLAIGDSSNSCYYSTSINIQSLIDCNFSYDSIAPLTYRFYTSEEEDVSYLWDLGNGITYDSSSMFIHTFSDTGTYNVCLLKTDSIDSCQYCNEIIVGPLERDSLYIDGNVYADLMPVFEGTVELYRKDSSEWHKISQVNLSNGHFRFNELMEGQYLLYARGDEEVYDKYIPTYFVNGINWRDAYTLNLTGAIEEVKITLIKSYQLSSPGAGTVSGHLIEAEDDDYVVILKDGNSNKTLGWDITNNGRDFHFGQLPFGKYRVILERPSASMSQTFELTAENPDARGIELGPNMVAGVESQLNGISVYPTELKRHITLENKSYENKDLSVELKAITGRNFISTSVNMTAGEALKMEVPQLPSGIYMLQLTDQNGEVKIYKLIKS
ncbi:PKD domain-containing protein [Fulvivirga sediminis]|uniref:PKD domain-containing protein n=1 Tax=Fulvivirga sediminis TaxID=2803949 RepID=A0A937F953_9BACT|nr:PKD domain-containing protein [Fulvivirga sediminis]MBL3656308.1 PKD domain-containing protein [Fulvivirga sediminis]